MVIEQLETIIEQIFFWTGVGTLIISFLYIVVTFPNTKNVFQISYGKKRFQGDKYVGAAMITVVISVISMTLSWKAIHITWGLLASAVFLLLLFISNEAYWRAFRKTIGTRIASFFNWIEVLVQGKSRKE